jgi:hypothetical protein
MNVAISSIAKNLGRGFLGGPQRPLLREPGQRRCHVEVGTLGGVVEHHVEQHFQACGMQGVHHGLELTAYPSTSGPITSPLIAQA